jgi:Protein of unknown function (DUF998)
MMIESLVRPGFDWRTMFVSELALGPRGSIQISNFLLLGVSQLLFARGIAAEFPDGRASRAGAILLALVGLGFLFGGAFVMDPVGTPRADRSWHGRLHGFPFGPLIVFGWPLACLILWRRFRVDACWRPLAGAAFTAGVLSAVLAVVFWLQTLSLLIHPELGYRAPWVGAVQRGHHLVLLAWQLVVAAWLYRRS